jgi:Domain of unknown function (DUF4432)
VTCRITRSEIAGWRALTLANAKIAVTVLPDKGADIFSFIDVASGTDVLMKTPWGLQPPGSAPRPSSGADRFLHNYEGGWQELFPNTGPACTHGRHDLPLHGEVATLAWRERVEREDLQEVCVALEVRCRMLPLSLTRKMSVSEGGSALMLRETVHNLSDRLIRFTWGHHPVVGSPFLEAGCRLSVGGWAVHTPDVPFDAANVSYAAGQNEIWPEIRGIDGSAIDLSVIPGPEANTHDHASITDLDLGWIAIANPRLRLVFSIEWDPHIFRWINNWRPFGGSHRAPLEDIYGLGLEPWVTRGNLTEALATQSALELAGGDTLDTWLRADLRDMHSGVEAMS